MKKFILVLTLTCSIAHAITIEVTINNLYIGANLANATTYGENEGQYRLVTFNVDNPSAILGYGTLTAEGKVQNTTTLTQAGTYMSALFDNVDTFYFLSPTFNGPMLAGTAQVLTPQQASLTITQPLSLDDIVNRGELCHTLTPSQAWFLKYQLTESALAGIPANLVNLAFAVNANPTDFSGVDLSVSELTFSPTSLTGTFTFNAKNAAGTPTAVTKLNDPNAIVISSTDSLAAPFSPDPASSISLDTNTFEAETASSIQFLRLDFTPAELW